MEVNFTVEDRGSPHLTAFDFVEALHEVKEKQTSQGLKEI